MVAPFQNISVYWCLTTYYAVDRYDIQSHSRLLWHWVSSLLDWTDYSEYNYTTFVYLIQHWNCASVTTAAMRIIITRLGMLTSTNMLIACAPLDWQCCHPSCNCIMHQCALAIHCFHQLWVPILDSWIIYCLLQFFGSFHHNIDSYYRIYSERNLQIHFELPIQHPLS